MGKFIKRTTDQKRQNVKVDDYMVLQERTNFRSDGIGVTVHLSQSKKSLAGVRL